MAESINDIDQLPDLQALQISSKRRMSIQPVEASMASSTRRTVAELMERAKNSPFKPPTRTIASSCKEFADQNKVTYATEYQINTNNSLLKVEYNVLVKIFEYLVGNRSFQAVSHMRTENSIRNLRMTNKQLYAMVREWMGHILKVRIKKPELPPCVSESIQHQPFKFLISPEIGIFDPRTTTIVLDATFFGEGQSKADLLLEKQLALSRLVTSTICQVHQDEVRNVQVVVRQAMDALDFIKQLSYFQKLETFEIVIPTTVPGGPHERKMVEFCLWSRFWASVSACHPGVCCSCCGELPELKIRTSDAGTGIAKLIPTLHPMVRTTTSSQVGANKWYNGYFEW